MQNPEFLMREQKQSTNMSFDNSNTLPLFEHHVLHLRRVTIHSYLQYFAESTTV